MSTITWVWRELDEFTPRALFDYLRLRTDVFVVEQECAYPELDDHDLTAAHLTGYQDGRLVAALRLVPPGTLHAVPSLGRVVVAPEARGTGTGHLLVAEALREAAARYPGHGHEISAQAHLQAFYAAHGFVAHGHKYLEDGIPHVTMSIDPARRPEKEMDETPPGTVG
jgi:ElaA protein